ncbi:MAG: universal stress protein [Proteobacteria bacterium]|nr:universal stress protein [Pseudomonadota bacterium]
MFRKILFATTASSSCESAARVAFDLARRYEASLYAFHVFGVPTHGDSPFVTDVKTGKEESMYDLEYTSWVREEVRNIYANEIEKTAHCEIECRVGVPYREILRKARKESVDAIVMGSHTCMGDSQALHYRNVVGNTMQMVAKNARCPVFIISRPCNTCLWQLKTIAFGTDFSKASYSAFQFAASMARQVGSQLLIFHSVDITPHQFGLLEDQPIIEKKLEAARARIEREYLPDIMDLDHEIHVWEGIPHVEFLKFSREKEADLIIMAHHNTDVVGDDGFLGSMVEQVVLRSRCPVISVNRPCPAISPGLWDMEKGFADAH